MALQEARWQTPQPRLHVPASAIDSSSHPLGCLPSLALSWSQCQDPPPQCLPPAVISSNHNITSSLGQSVLSSLLRGHLCPLPRDSVGWGLISSLQHVPSIGPSSYSRCHASSNKDAPLRSSGASQTLPHSFSERLTSPPSAVPKTEATGVTIQEEPRWSAPWPWLSVRAFQQGQRRHYVPA